MILTIAEIIGILGFLLALFNTLEKFYSRWYKKINYYIIKSKQSNIIESFSNVNTNFETYYRAIIEIMIINKSNCPITVHGVSLRNAANSRRFSCVEREYLRSELSSRVYGISFFSTRTGLGGTGDEVLTDVYSTELPITIPPHEAKYIKTYFVFEKEFFPEKLMISTYKNIKIPNEYYINSLQKQLLSMDSINNH